MPCFLCKFKGEVFSIFIDGECKVADLREAVSQKFNLSTCKLVGLPKNLAEGVRCSATNCRAERFLARRRDVYITK
jgi:hypothetical protein